MTSFEIERLPFSSEALRNKGLVDKRYANWPVVYLIDSATSPGTHKHVYVGETVNAVGRMRQHSESAAKRHLSTVRVVLNETFNKSVCLDLESHLIRWLSGDGTFEVLNRNEGMTDADYFDRDRYRRTFQDVFDRLRAEGLFTRSIREIENDDLFKLSPFKALTTDQATAVEDILEGLFEDLEMGRSSTIVIQGDPGTGKTVVAIYMMKLLQDIATSTSLEDLDPDSMFSDFFVEGNRELLRSFRVGLVIPQQSLRESIKKVFRRTPGLSVDMVLTPFQVGEAEGEFDLLIVDEAHRLNQRANQPSGMQNKRFRDITIALFGSDDVTKTQLDWIVAKSRHRIFLLDAAQSVRPADLPTETLRRLADSARATGRHYPLTSQLRVAGGADYVAYVRGLLAGEAVGPPRFKDYDFRIFDNLAEMRDEIRARDAEVGLSRLVAGYAWPWRSKNDRTAFDIEIDGVQLRWNSAQTDWIASPGSIDEVGSIHTVQGYDLNYAGVIIGPDLRFDPVTGRIVVDRNSYFDSKGKENNPQLGRVYSDEDLLRFITNIYAVLMTRGIRGTYLYVADRELRSKLNTLRPAGVDSSRSLRSAVT